jgi:hypothetical protein
MKKTNRDQRRTPWHGVCHALNRSALGLLATLLPCSLLANPIIVTINDVPNGPPVIQVQGAPNGYDIYTGEGVANPTIEDGALITLFGVNNYFDPGALPEWGGRFVVPAAPLWYRTAVDIVWVSHDADVFGLGDLQVGFDSAHPGTYYYNPGLVIPGNPPIVVNTDEDLGLVTDNWVTAYSNDTLVVRYKPHTYRLPVERPFKLAGLIDFAPTSDLGGTFGVVGNATHLGDFVGDGTYEVTGVSDDGLKVFFHVTATWTAANGDTIDLDMPDWVNQYDASGNAVSSTGLVNIIGGTGRFAGASGSYFGDISPPVINPGVPNDLTGEGTIAY